jgi:fibronectin-binding autotransporter adhesin
MKFFKKLIVGIVLFALGASTIGTVFAADRTQNLLKLISASSVNPVVSTWTLGNVANPWAEGHFTDLYTVNLAVSAATVGGIDLNGADLIRDVDGDTIDRTITDDVTIHLTPSGGSWNWMIGGTNDATMDVDGLYLKNNIDVDGFAEIAGTMDVDGVAVFDLDEEEAFIIRKNGDGGDVITVDTLSPGAAHVAPPSVFKIRSNGGVAYTGSGNQINILDSLSTIDTGSQTGRLRGMNSVITFSGDAVQTGTDGDQIRSFNTNLNWNSTGTAASLVAEKSFVAMGGGGGVTTGLVSEIVVNDLKFGWNTNDAGSVTDGTNLYLRAPKNIDANHTIVTSNGVVIEDMGGTGVTNSFAIDVENQTAGGYAIRTGSGIVEFGDDVTATADFTANKTVILGDGTSNVSVDSNGWDISADGTFSNLAFDANSNGNTLSGVVNTDLDVDTLDFDRITDASSLDAAWSLTGTAGETITFTRTLTDATAENGVTFSFTAQDTTTSTGDQYGLYLDNLASTEGLDAMMVLDNSDADDAVSTLFKVVDAGGGITNFLEGAVTISMSEFSILDGGITLGELTDSGTLTASGGGSLTGTWSDLGDVTTINIDGGTVDGVTIGGASAGAGTFTDLTANNSGIFSRNVADAGAVMTITQTNSGSTGDILQAGNDTGTMLTLTQEGEVRFTPESGVSMAYGGSTLEFGNTGDSTISAKNSGADDAGVTLNIDGSDGGGATTGGTGGDIAINLASAGGSGDNKAGSWFFNLGSPTGSGADGNVFIVPDGGNPGNAVAWSHDGTDSIWKQNATDGGFAFYNDTFDARFEILDEGVLMNGITIYEPSDTQVLTAGTGLTVTQGIMRIDSGAAGSVTMTATPTIIDPSDDGTCVTIQGDDDTNDVTFQDEGNLAGSGLAMSGGIDFTFGQGDMWRGCYDSGDDKWFEVSRSDN